MTTNTIAPIALCKAFLPALKQAKGQIVNVSSLAGLVGVSVRTVYSGSKFALTGFSKALRSEVKPHGISVSMIYPGYVQTNISNNACTGVHGE